MIHKEGIATLSIVFTVCLATLLACNYFLGEGMYLFWVAVFSASIFLFFLQFFRNPKPNFVANPNAIIAPADGKIVVIEKTFESEYLKTECIQISIFMSPMNVHVNRNPASGTISYFKYHPGTYLVAWHPKASTDNERTTTALRLINGDTILYRQIAGALARRICWYIKEQDLVHQGEEFGFIKFGSRVDVFIPLSYKVQVQLNQVSKGGETILAIIS